MPSINCTLNRRYLQADAEKLPTDAERAGALFLSIDVEPGITEGGKGVVPNVVLLIDSSGSMMSERKLEMAKEAAKQFVEGLDDVSNVSVISFSEVCNLVCRGQGKKEGAEEKGLLDRLLDSDVVTPEKSEMLECIDQIEAKGGTALFSALENAMDEILATNVESEKRIDRVIVLSDGQPTVGHSLVEDFRDIAELYATENISITCGGIGGDYSEDILIALAEHSRKGKWRHLKTASDITELFKSEAKRIKETTMIKPDIIINPIKGFELGDIYQAEPEVSHVEDIRVTEGSYIIPIGDLVEGEKQTYVAQIFYPSRPEGSFRIAQVSISDLYTQDILVTYSTDPEQYKEEDDSSPRHHFLTAKASLFGRDVIDGDSSKMDTVIKMTSEVISEGADKDLVNRATQIKETIMDKDTVILSNEEKKEKKGTLSTTVILED